MDVFDLTYAQDEFGKMVFVPRFSTAEEFKCSLFARELSFFIRSGDSDYLRDRKKITACAG